MQEYVAHSNQGKATLDHIESFKNLRLVETCCLKKTAVTCRAFTGIFLIPSLLISDHLMFVGYCATY